MSTLVSLFTRRRLTGWLASAVVMSALALVWVGYRAVSEWQHAAGEVALRRAEAAVDLLLTALARDMRGAQRALTDIEQRGLAGAKPIDLLHPVASAFARYPYTEAFFSWRSGAPATRLVFYSRSERRPSWMSHEAEPRDFPVVVGNNSEISQLLHTRLMRDVTEGRQLSIFDTMLAGVPYQVVARITYDDALHVSATGVFGYVVNLSWARSYYFAELANQVARIESADQDIVFSICDTRGEVVTGNVTHAPGTARSRPFQMAFFDPLTIAVDPPPDLSIPLWTAMAAARNDPTLAAAERGARRALAIAAAMALVLTVGLILSLQAGRASAKLAEMRSDFVSAVTHELKTPLANLRAIHETMASGRVTVQMSREYSQMGIREASRLARLVDNLLAYARITDVADAYAFEPVDLHAVVERTIREFSANLQHGQFVVETDLPEQLPLIKGDPTALSLMLNNLVDNAIRYSASERSLRIAVAVRERQVVLSVSDKGIGIAPDDLPKVTRKFSRGHGTNTGGSGLGLAIVDRIVHDHGGMLDITSRVGAGTTVTVAFPIAS